jgi:hypothetical protein
MQPRTNNTFLRLLIDKELKSSRWNLLDASAVRIELNGATGKAGYTFKGDL